MCEQRIFGPTWATHACIVNVFCLCMFNLYTWCTQKIHNLLTDILHVTKPRKNIKLVDTKFWAFSTNKRPKIGIYPSWDLCKFQFGVTPTFRYFGRSGFTHQSYLHALGNCRRTAKAARAVGWTRGRADGQPDSRVDVLPRGHVHAMLLFARIWHLQWVPCDVHVHKTILFACIWQP